MNEIKQGSCLCGAVRFRTRGGLRGVLYCHCSQCRRQTGHHYAATEVDDERLVIEDAGTLTWYAASGTAKRGFCRVCGSALFWKENGARGTSIMAGSFDQPTGLTEGAHIFVSDKGDYYQINDDLPQHVGSSSSPRVADTGKGDT